MPSLNPALLSDARILAGYLIFFGSYFVFALGKFPWTKIDRPGAAIIGAVLMVAFRIVGAQEALASIDFATIVLLFSMMLIVANLRIGGFFDWITEWLIERLQPHHLLPTVIFSSGLLSAFLVNDVVCLVMTPFVVHMARRLGVPAGPVRRGGRHSVEHRQRGDDHRQPAEHADRLAVRNLVHRIHCASGAGRSGRAVPELGVCFTGSISEVRRSRCGAEALTAPELRRGRIRKKPVVVLMIVLAGFLVGVPPAMVAAVGGALLLITRTVEPRKVYDEVDWGLLVFFLGLFIIVGGAERAGLTANLLRPVTAWNLHRLPIFVAATTALSNVVSNVPAVMLLRTLIPAFPNPHDGWLALAMSSTLAGNLTITGSVANIIVVERAAAEGVPIGFRDYFRVGFPLTVATLIVGSLWLGFVSRL